MSPEVPTSAFSFPRAVASPGTSLCSLPSCPLRAVSSLSATLLMVQVQRGLPQICRSPCSAHLEYQQLLSRPFSHFLVVTYLTSVSSCSGGRCASSQGHIPPVPGTKHMPREYSLTGVSEHRPRGAHPWEVGPRETGRPGGLGKAETLSSESGEWQSTGQVCTLSGPPCCHLNPPWTPSGPAHLPVQG